MSQEKINQALDILYQEGIKHYKPEYRENADRFGAIGLAIAEVESNALNFAKLAYVALEDWNHHSACSILDWIFPQMNPMSKDSPAEDYLVTLEQMEKIIGDRIVTVFTKWNNIKNDYDIAKYRVRLVIEEVKN